MIANLQAISDMDRYIDDILSGNIVACGAMKQAVQRHVDDLNRDNFPYVFDRSKANSALESFPVIFRHTQGKFAGSPFVPSPFAAFGIGSIYGWRCVDGTRRFRRVYWSTGRKTGKSMIAMGLAVLMAKYDGEAQAQVWLGATKQDQAKRIIFAEAQRNCRQSPALRDANVKVLTIEFGDSYIAPVGSDRAFDGLFPSCVIFDELHAWKEQHRAFYDTLTTGFGSRLQPLRFTITTAGDKNSLMWKEEISHARHVLDRTIEEESYFVLIAEMDKEDDLLNEGNWAKSMPNIGEVTPYETIRELAREAEYSPAAMNRFKRYFANMEVSSISQALAPEDWDECEVDELSDWNLADVVTGAMDAGGMNDLAATATVARFPVGFDDEGTPEFRYEVRGRCYMDVDTGRDMDEQPWMAWVETGKLSMTPSVFSHMRDDLALDMQQVGGRQIGFDPWNLRQMGEELQAEGFECVRIPQNRYNLHEPLRLFLELVQKKRITHDGSWPLLRWAIENLVINSDSNERWMPDRKQSSDKIDPVLAVIMALRLASLAPARPKGSLFLA